jgi:hypothetical protein
MNWILKRIVACCLASVIANATLADCGGPAASDWMTTAVPLAAPIRPAHCSDSDQTPPDFSWPAYKSDSVYEFELRRPDGATEKRSASRNWLLWDEKLLPGSYAWRVSARAGGGSRIKAGAWRQFTISRDARVFVVPDDAGLIAKAVAKGRPRAFPSGDARDRLIASLKNERRAAWDDLLAGLSRPVSTAEGLDLPVWMERINGQKAYSKALGDSKREAGKDFDRLLDAAFAFMVTGQKNYRIEAIAKLREISRWSDTGATGVSHHQVAGRYVWILALTYDWLYPYLSPAERRMVIDAISSRMEALLDEFGIADGKMDRSPYNSHGWVALGEMAAAASLLVGDDPRARGWFLKTVRPFIHSISPWAGPEGGMANGTGYGIWDMTALLIPMDILGYSMDMNLYDKAPLRNMMHFLAQFIPPGSPNGRFGDAAERAADLWVGDFVRAYAMRAPSAATQWYASQWSPRKHSLMHVYAPAYADAGESEPETSNGEWSRTLGWVAMHSEIANPGRTSVYFKSSPYGSFNHSHADQNSFEIVSDGHPVLVDSGFYDYYKSPHWLEWYTQTKAHNAITFDGGIGQKAGDRGSAGEVLSFEQRPDYDVARGDSRRAYDGTVHGMLRTLIFVRPNKLLVIDRASSLIPRSWEWNMHSLAAFAKAGENVVIFPYGNSKACVSMYSPQAMSFDQRQGFSVKPDPKWDTARESTLQWHGMFKSEIPTRELEIVALIEMECSEPAALRVSATKVGLSVLFDNYNFAYETDGSVRRLP